jgi:hypothetical protein
MIRKLDNVKFYGLPIAFLKEHKFSSLGINKKDISYQDNLQTFVYFNFDSFLFDLVKEKDCITIYSQYALPITLYPNIILAFSKILKIKPYCFDILLEQDEVLKKFTPEKEILNKLVGFLENSLLHTKENTLILPYNPQYLGMNKYGNVIVKNEPDYE